MSGALNDVALAAFGAAAIFAWTRLLDRPGPAAAAVAGVLAGLAMGVKYPALVLFGLMGGWLWVRGLNGLLSKRLGDRDCPGPLTPSLPCGASAIGRPLRRRSIRAAGANTVPFSRGEKVPEGRDEGGGYTCE